MSILGEYANSAYAFMLAGAQHYQSNVNYIAYQQSTSANLPVMTEYVNNLSAQLEIQPGNYEVSSSMLPCFSNSQGPLPTQQSIASNVSSSNRTSSIANANNDLPDVKKYRCDFCDKRFKTSHSLTTHKV
jgi:hypothetical protein